MDLDIRSNFGRGTSKSSKDLSVFRFARFFSIKFYKNCDSLVLFEFFRTSVKSA